MREQTQVQHTPGPWGRSGIFLTANGVTLAKAIYSVDGPSAETAFENARHILNCVNTHDELVEALRKLEVAANTVAYCYEKNLGNFAQALRDLDEESNAARTALQKAGATP